MTSNASSLHDSSRTRHESSSTSPLERHTSSSSTSDPHSFAFGSNAMAESSVSAGQRQSLMTGALQDVSVDGAADGSQTLDTEKPVKDGRGSHRSHKSRSSGGFLLSNAAFEGPAGNLKATATPADSLPRHRHSTHDPKGKSPLRSPEKKSSKRKSHLGDHTGSPRAVGESLADNGNDAVMGGNTDGTKREAPTAGRVTSAGLDVDSAQIVNMALNLSESRRNASRRVVSLPPVPNGIGESFAGGSLRQHLQQQRRIPRTVSPKPDRGDRAMTALPRVASGQRVNSPLQPAFEHPEGSYQYHFSASTLARAERARNTIELLAEYRRLLEYVPPLKPDALSRVTTTTSTAGSPKTLPFSPIKSGQSSTCVNETGRQYNPLQYIRNRKLRARNSRAIDGEAQGFGDIERVSSWVDQVVESASSASRKNSDAPAIPSFSVEAEQGAASPQTSPRSTLMRNQNPAVKVKRPRLDWIITPADLLADAFWLEQDDNKKLIEDHHGRRIFPQDAVLTRPTTRRSEEPELKGTPSPRERHDDIEPDLRIDTKIPDFKPVKSDNERLSDSTTSKARQKLRDVRDSARIRHGHSNSIRDGLYFKRGGRSRSRSSSSSSDSDSLQRPRRRRSGTTDSHDRGKDILEKQMMEMLAKEAKQNERYSPHNIEGQKTAESIESPMPIFKRTQERSKNGKDRSHSRSTSLVDQEKKGSSGRPSLEVPGVSPRRSLEGHTSTTPSSPQSNAQRLSNAFIPGIGTDMSSPTKSRPSSPTRGGLSRIKSKIRPLYERHHESMPLSAREKISGSDLENRRRSLSPVKVVGKTSEDGQLPSGTGSIRKNKPEDVSGIRGLFKGSRNTNKDTPTGVSSGFSTDESDVEDLRARKKGDRASRESSAGFPSVDSKTRALPSFVKDMPTFTSPFERRGRPTQAKADEEMQKRIIGGRNKRKSGGVLGTPRIELQDASPASSPERGRSDRYRRDSSISNDSRPDSSRVRSADARLNAVIGASGRRRNAIPMTGLADLEPTREGRPSLDGKRQWSISDRGVSVARGPMTKREVARVRALLLSSGIKAKEIGRRAAEVKNIATDDNPNYADIAPLAQESPVKVPRSQEHKLALRILSEDVQLSAHLWQSSAESFSHATIAGLVEQLGSLQSRLSDSLTPMTRSASDEADAAQMNLVTSQTLQIKNVSDKIDMMRRKRRRRFRWLRRGGWVLIEWGVVGFMWWMWFMVTCYNIVLALGHGFTATFRWLFWL